MPGKCKKSREDVKERKSRKEEKDIKSRVETEKIGLILADTSFTGR